MNTGTLQEARHETVVDFSISHVKTTLNELFKQFPTKFMLGKDGCNDTFNSFHFTIVRGLIFAITDITLCEVSENKTKITICAKNAHGASTSNAILAGMTNDFLTVFGKMLNGDSVETVKQAAKNSGCAVTLILAIGSLTLLSLMLA